MRSDHDEPILLSDFGAGPYRLVLLEIYIFKMDGSEPCRKIVQINRKTKKCFMTAFESSYASQ